MLPDPQRFPELYSKLLLGGKKSPGVVTLSGHDREFGWDVKKATGQSGAKMSRTGEDPIAFDASFYLVRNPSFGIDQWTDWEEWVENVWLTVSGKQPIALDIWHPDLDAIDIRSVVAKKIGGASYDGKGGKTHVVSFLEYFPPAKKTGAPVGSKPKVDPNDPNAERLKVFQELSDRSQVTPWGGGTLFGLRID